jgi:hypothetical protein
MGPNQLIVGVTVAPSDAAADHAAWWLDRCGRCLEGEVAQRLELGFDPFNDRLVCRADHDR